MSTMERAIIETVNYTNTSSQKTEKFLRLGHLKQNDSIAKPKEQCEKGSLVRLPNKTTNKVRLIPSERDSLSK